MGQSMALSFNFRRVGELFDSQWPKRRAIGLGLNNISLAIQAVAQKILVEG